MVLPITTQAFFASLDLVYLQQADASRIVQREPVAVLLLRENTPRALIDWSSIIGVYLLQLGIAMGPRFVLWATRSLQSATHTKMQVCIDLRRIRTLIIYAQ